MSSDPSNAVPNAPTRDIINADAMAWLQDPANKMAGVSVITSLPDISEVPERGFEGWRGFFVQAARLVSAWVPDDGVAIFFQSDIKQDGRWIDKGYWVQRALEDTGTHLLWHKVVCRRPPGTVTYGRASYSHMLCFSRGVIPTAHPAFADVMPDAGHKPWNRAMGTEACMAACQFVAQQTTCRTVVDPFCGHGTALAVANALGMNALGVELSSRKCRKARALSFTLDEKGALAVPDLAATFVPPAL